MSTILSKEDNRLIKFNGHWSNEEKFDLTMAGNTPLPVPTPKISSTDISGSDGNIDTSWSSGYIRFNSIVVTYTFTHAINRCDDSGRRRPLNEMNRLMKEHVSTIEEWIFGLSPNYNNQSDDGLLPLDIAQGRLYDTGICDPETKTGHYLFNARCTNFSAGKVISSDKWVIQYSIEMTADPYMYEYDANPETYTMFSGPSDDAIGMGETTVRVFTLSGLDNSEETLHPSETASDRPLRYLWTNDNITWLTTSSVTKITDDEIEATFTFRPATVPIYYGKIGVYMNRYMVYTFEGTTYSYRLDDIRVTSGECTFISSSKIATPNEMAYTDQNGYSIRCKISTNYDGTGAPTIDQLNSASSGKIPISFIWGTIKEFYLPKDTDFAISGEVKGINAFKQVTGASPDTIYTIVRKFGEPFQFDNDPYNELIMPTKSYGFYKLVSPDNYRRTI